MWTKTEKGLDPLFVAPSTVRNRAEISGYFKYQQVATPLSGMPSPSSNSSVLWKANSARRKRFDILYLKVTELKLKATIQM
uniref:Uncharacterized protein n=1 Tax=Parascaris equorum TaxID=6256 RepID=A0A914SIX8_PAREQ